MKLFHTTPESIPHPELLPVYDHEWTYTSPNGRDPMLSRRDYSEEEIDQAQRRGNMPLDMMEYCHNNGIAWQIPR